MIAMLNMCCLFGLLLQPVSEPLVVSESLRSREFKLTRNLRGRERVQTIGGFSATAKLCRLLLYYSATTEMS